jgi:hypothetical protein
MSDIVFDNLVFDRLREIGDQRDRITALEDEIARLRLTDAEREAIQYFIDGGPDDVVSDPPHLAVLERLLERTKGDTNAV